MTALIEAVGPPASLHEGQEFPMTPSLTPPADTRMLSPALRDVRLWVADDRLDVDEGADVELAVRVARGLLPLVLDCDREACVAALDGQCDLPVDCDLVFDRAVAAGPAGACAAAACLTARRDPGVSLCWSHDAYVAAHFDADPMASLTFVAALLA